MSIALSHHITIRGYRSPLLNMSGHLVITIYLDYKSRSRVGQNRKISVGEVLGDTFKYLRLNESFREDLSTHSKINVVIQ